MEEVEKGRSLRQEWMLGFLMTDGRGAQLVTREVNL
jgi:hypothetical protein